MKSITISIWVFIIVVGSIIAGSYFVSTESKRYIGDISTNKFYDYNCGKYIETENRIHFESLNVSDELNYTYSRCQ